MTLLTVTMGALYAPTQNGGGTTTGNTPGGLAIYASQSTDSAYDGVSKSTSSVVTAPTVMAVQTAKIMGLLVPLPQKLLKQCVVVER